MDGRAMSGGPEVDVIVEAIGVAILHLEKPFSHRRAASPDVVLSR